ARFTGHYGRIMVATNQQGVAKGVMSAEQLAEVHSEMCDRVEEAGGVIDSVYSCTDSSASNSPDRKPAPGIALAAAEYYPEIDLSRSLMIGDSLSDMQFAANAGMACAFISNGGEVPKEVYDYTLAVCRDLREFCTFVPALNE
ncbi:MAG: HAD-IIIA family hydrolase, partial [Bacteroidales bacterium]|nr:HAD-IIIA family hydrolase [Bacteroidales bacterium]